jgi:hypothetical protein
MQLKDCYKLYPNLTVITDNMKSNLISIHVFLGCDATQVWQMGIYVLDDLSSSIFFYPEA